MSPKYCFFDKERVCDLTCKAAFESGDPVDEVDCYFVWASHHAGEGLFELRRVLEAFGNGAGFPFPPSAGPGPGPGGGSGTPGPGFGPRPKGSEDDPSNN